MKEIHIYFNRFPQIFTLSSHFLPTFASLKHFQRTGHDEQTRQETDIKHRDHADGMYHYEGYADLGGHGLSGESRLAATSSSRPRHDPEQEDGGQSYGLSQYGISRKHQSLARCTTQRYDLSGTSGDERSAVCRTVQHRHRHQRRTACGILQRESFLISRHSDRRRDKHFAGCGEGYSTYRPRQHQFVIHARAADWCIQLCGHAERITNRTVQCLHQSSTWRANRSA